MHVLLQHLRYTLRLLRKSPGFTITAILILGFGIGINTAIFSLIYEAMLKPLPFPDPERLVEVCTPYQREMLRWVDYPDYLDMAVGQHTFESISVIAVPQTLDLGGAGQAEQVQVYFVSPSLAKVSGLPMKLGRWLSMEEDVPHGPLVAVLSERFWRSRFQSDPSIVGKDITLSGWSFKVIGVTPIQASASGPPIADVYAPTNAITTVLNWSLWERDNHIVDCLGRLKKGVSIAQAQAELETLHNNLIARYPDKDAGYGLRIVPLGERVVVDYSQTIWLLGAAAACLLLISGANVANLLYARAVERRQEMSIRSALGGTRFRLLGQCLLETSLLSVFGATFGVGLAFGIVEIIKRIAPPDLYRLEEVNIDINALLFVSAVTVFISLFSGLLPAWKLSRTDVPTVLKAESGRTNTAGRERLRTQAFMVVSQVAIACLLLISAGLLTRSFLAVQSVPLGFNPHQILTAQITLTSAKYTLDAKRTRAFWDEVFVRARQLPGVERAGMNCDPPLKYGFQIMVPYSVDGQPDPGPGRQAVLSWQMVSPDFFGTLGIPLVQGHDFGSQDRIDTQKVIIVDQALADKYWPAQDAIGKVIRLPGNEACTIVGVAAHIRYMSPDDPDSGPPAYFPYNQWDRADEILLLRAKGDPIALVPALRKMIASIDPYVALGGISTYDDTISDRYLARKLGVLLVSVFSGAALFLSAIGLYGTLVYSVNQRTREIGIRIALGATATNILRLVIKRGLALVGIGLAIGILAAMAGSRFIESLLYEVKGNDPVTLGLAIFVLCLTASIACLAPALRATKVDPIAALRQ